MTSLLEHPLVLQYFGTPFGAAKEYTAFRVLRAMEQPIRQGERYIALSGPHVLGVMEGAIEDEGYHPSNLRLPDAFQGLLDADPILTPEEVSCPHETMPPCGFCGAIAIYTKPEPKKCSCPFQNAHDIFHHSWCAYYVKDKPDPVEEDIKSILASIDSGVKKLVSLVRQQ